MDSKTTHPSERLANELRRIIARLTVVRPPADELERAADAAAAFADRLDELPERTQSWEISEAGLHPRDFLRFSPVSGANNPIAPPLKLSIDDDEAGTAINGEVTFGPAYEGPPGHAHGGYVAAMFDELLGFAMLAPGFTAYLKVDYRKPTPLHKPLTLRAQVESVEGRKRIVRGRCTLDDVVLSEAEGLFLGPRDDEDYLARLWQTS